MIARLLQAARLLLAEERTAIIRKEKDKWVVRSPHNKSWCGGRYDTKEEAEKRLREVEGFKHRGGSFVSAGLADDLTSKMSDLLARPLDVVASKDVAAFLADRFSFQVARTPSGQKDLKKAVESLHWWLQHGVAQYRDNPEAARTSIEHAWGKVEPHLADLVRNFSAEGGRNVPKEIVVGANTYVNLVGFSEPQLRKYSDSLEKVFSELRGWRTRALTGGVRVVLAGPRDFRGTASGTYRSAEDALYVRATPKVLQRTAGTYGAFDYIIVHELGHRYQAVHRSMNVDFDRPEWLTSKYSHKDGEGFAELFALSNFGIHGYGSPETLERFEALMSGRDHQPKPELPEHLRHLKQL